MIDQTPEDCLIADAFQEEEHFFPKVALKKPATKSRWSRRASSRSRSAATLHEPVCNDLKILFVFCPPHPRIWN
jgi:hypothetical protein